MKPEERRKFIEQMAGMPVYMLLRMWQEANPGEMEKDRGIDNHAFVKSMLAIYGERLHQNEKYGETHDRKLSVPAFLTIMDSELNEAKEGWVRHQGDFFALDEMRQVAAVAEACFEVHGVPER